MMPAAMALQIIAMVPLRPPSGLCLICFFLADEQTDYCAEALLHRLKEESNIWCTVVTNKEKYLALGDTGVLLPPQYDGIQAVFSGAVFSQMFSCLCSLSRGYDPDNPKGVSKKTVTI